MSAADKTTVELLAEVLSEGVTYPQVVALATYMADEGYTAHQIAYAIEKPWKHQDLIAKALEVIE